MKLDEKVLRELAQLSNTERTILSIYISLTKKWDTALDFVQKETKRLIPLLNANEKDFFETSLSFFKDKIKELKEEKIKAPGLAFFADLGAEYTAVIELSIAPEPLVAVDDEAILHPLARIHDEYEPVGIIMIDASGARILVTAGEILDDAASLRTKIHHLSKVGGWSQMRYQRRRAKQVQHFSKEIVEHATQIFQQENVRRILIAGRDRMITALEQELPRELKKKIIATVRWDLDKTDALFLNKIKPILEQAERDQEDKLLARLIGELRRGGLAIAGNEPIRQALSLGQVDTLFLSMRLEKTLTEELVSIAESTAAYVEFIPDENQILQECGGIAALLRYRVNQA